MEAPLSSCLDVTGLVEQYEETHPLKLEGHRRTSPPRVLKGIASLNSLVHLRRDARLLIWILKKEGLPRGANRVVYTTL